MIKKENLKQIIRDFHLQGKFDVIPRDIPIPLNTGKIITIMGVRRCGKTCVLLDTINMLSKDVDKTQILYVNFEDERLGLTAEELDLIIQSYSELYPEQDLGACYFFFDEIQNVEKWERFVRRIYDTITRNIFITGSNSKLLSSEIATSLRGRTLSLEVFPLSFSEYLRFKDIEIDLYSSRQLAFIRNAQSGFFKNGGFPETLFVDEKHRIPLLQEYFNVLVYKDLVERYDIQNVSALKYFLKRVVASATKQISTHKIYNELKSAGIKIGKNALYDFLDYAGNVYLALLLYRFDPSLVAREMGEKKVYAIDTGICDAIEYRFAEDMGKALENSVFLELRRLGHEQFYYRSDTSECDFLLSDRGKVFAAIQVCHTFADNETKKRELKGLTEACSRFGLDKGLIITSDLLDQMEFDGLYVDIVPFYKFFSMPQKASAELAGSP